MERLHSQLRGAIIDLLSIHLLHCDSLLSKFERLFYVRTFSNRSEDPRSLGNDSICNILSLKCLGSFMVKCGEPIISAGFFLSEDSIKKAGQSWMLSCFGQ